jgi:hypothetical protein
MKKKEIKEILISEGFNMGEGGMGIFYVDHLYSFYRFVESLVKEFRIKYSISDLNDKESQIKISYENNSLFKTNFGECSFVVPKTSQFTETLINLLKSYGNN